MKKKILFLVLLPFLAANVFAASLSDLMIIASDGTFLGNFKNQYDQKSIYNKYGNCGSKYNSDSIFNKYGNYGSDYSNLSPFNKYSNEGPWLMDRNGYYYGRLSINKYAQGVTDFSYNLAWQLKAMRDAMY